MDTGGSNWDVIYKEIDKNLIKVTLEVSTFDGSNNVDFSKYSSDLYQFIDGRWIHSFNGSNYFGNDATTEKVKNDRLFSMLDKYLN